MLASLPMLISKGYVFCPPPYKPPYGFIAAFNSLSRRWNRVTHHFAASASLRLGAAQRNLEESSSTVCFYEYVTSSTSGGGLEQTSSLWFVIEKTSTNNQNEYINRPNAFLADELIRTRQYVSLTPSTFRCAVFTPVIGSICYVTKHQPITLSHLVEGTIR